MVSRRKSTSYSDVQYSQLSSSDFTPAQFTPQAAVHIPWKAIALALVLSVAGLVMLLVGGLIVGGVIDTKYQDRMWPLLILGTLMLIPGAYHVRLAYYAYKRFPGYTFEDIPELE